MTRTLLTPPPPLDVSRTALFADLDGTLAEIRPRPEDVGPDPARAKILAELGERLDGALAIVSGRSLDELDRILGGVPPAVSATHGLVRRGADGGVVSIETEPIPDWVLERLRKACQQRAGLLLENKRVSAALHFRAAPNLAEFCVELAEVLARESGMTVQPGDMVVELRPPGATKAEAVTAFMAEAPFAGRRPIFVGDDLTDEDGFAGAERLGGHGVIVGPRRPTRARYALADVEAVLAWLSPEA
ncbi:trehalose-phosphatase [Phenylobacterium montanum]|uniref:Trehalose 6-phosphate phosphatase n=1 Tax=Phenylobacterium montanum TaxID=2823693 RepID=A0A975G1H2_9CAUL|nr:trehalose-phosphatase [Caulobacter sp. S6]QUD88823.1 trehalose-phosphatase [Caulobacter sp. S6]